MGRSALTPDLIAARWVCLRTGVYGRLSPTRRVERRRKSTGGGWEWVRLAPALSMQTGSQMLVTWRVVDRFRTAREAMEDPR